MPPMRLRGLRTVCSSSVANPKGGLYTEYVAVGVNNAAISARALGMKEAGCAATIASTALQSTENAAKAHQGLAAAAAEKIVLRVPPDRIAPRR
jgi:hypothetical protein